MGRRTAGERRVLPREHQDPHRPHATRGTLDRPERRAYGVRNHPQGGTHAHSGQGLVIPHGSCCARRGRHRRGHHRPARHRASRHGAGRHGSPRPPPSRPPPRPSRGDADLVIWADDTRDAGDRGDRRAVRRGERHHRRRPGAAVRRHPRAAVARPAPQGDGPDIIIGAHDWLGELVANGVVEPLDLSAVADGFNPVAVEAFTYEGQTYGLPYAVENIALVRNTDLVPEAPATFEELETIALQLKSEGTVETCPGDPAGPHGDPYHNYPMYSGVGGYVFGTNPDGSLNPQDVGLDSEGGLAAAELWEKWAAEGLVSGSVSQDIMNEQFANGQAPLRHHRTRGT